MTPKPITVRPETNLNDATRWGGGGGCRYQPKQNQTQCSRGGTALTQAHARSPPAREQTEATRGTLGTHDTGKWTLCTSHTGHAQRAHEVADARSPPNADVRPMTGTFSSHVSSCAPPLTPPPLVHVAPNPK